MLHFPTYRSELPTCLRLLKPSHYALFAYWIYFRPTVLKCYLYQAMPELYSIEQPMTFFRKWGNPAFRNLFFMIPVVCLVLSVLLSLPVTLWSASRLNVPVNWQQWLDSGMLGIALGITLGMAFGMVGRVLGGVALSSVFGVVYGVTVGVLGGVSFSVAFGIPFPSLVEGAVTVGTVFGVLAGTALTTDIEIGIALSFAFGVVAAISFGAEFLLFQLFGVRFGALYVRGMLSGAFVFGAFRLLFYPVQMLCAVCSLFYHPLHPIEWDELTILPLPLTRWVLVRKLRQDERQGLQFLKDLGRNLFRRASLKAVLFRHFHKHPDPLRFLYDVLADPAMEEYLLIPVTPQHWEQHVSVRRVFLGELALRPVEATKYPRFRRSTRWLNLRTRKQTVLTSFAGMLYDLLDQEAVEKHGVDVLAYHDVYSRLWEYPHGEEVRHSYRAMATFLSYSTLRDVLDAAKVSREFLQGVSVEKALRPAVLHAIEELGGIGKELTLCLETVNRQSQVSILAQATGVLNDLSDYIAIEVIAPESAILRWIITQWRQLIISAIGDVGKVGRSEMLVNDAQLVFDFEMYGSG